MKKLRLTRNVFFGFIGVVASSVFSPGFSQNTDIQSKQPVSIKTLVSVDQQILPMPVPERISRGVVPARGVVSIAPGTGQNDQLKTGNGKMFLNVNGNPLSEQIAFRHEHIQLPWPVKFEAPNIDSALPEVQRLILAGKYEEASEVSAKAAESAGMPGGTMNHGLLDAFVMKIGTAKDGQVKNYLRTVDFESGEVKVLWDDNRGSWERKTFVSRPDNVIVQQLSAPKGKLLNTKIEIVTGRSVPRVSSTSGTTPVEPVSPTQSFDRDFTAQRLIIMGHFIAPNTGNKGYAGVVRVVLDGGSATIDDGALVIKDAKSVTLITRIEWFKDFQKSKVDELVTEVNKITPDYQALLAGARKVQSEMFDRASLTFKTTKEQQAMSSEELLADQKTQIGFNLNLLSKMFDMGRYWLMLESGDFPPIYGHLNVNVNLQVCGANMANLPESMNSFEKWIEGLLPDSRVNAKNIFGARGALLATHPDAETGVLYHFDYSWPHHYWISSGGWSYNPIWDHYLVSGDKVFLRDHVMPGLRELGLFYEDYLKLKDEKGNFIFVPSYSPENWPANTSDLSLGPDRANPPSMINAVMDISVCREVLTHLIEGAEILGTDADKIPVWKDLLAKMPPYMLDSDGALKEWAWSTLEEFQDHRHISHMYGVWPADEVDPDRTPELAKAFWLANRKRAQGNGSGHGISHRMLSAARLKDDYLVNAQLKQFLEQGYVGTILTASHNPYTTFMPDQQGSILAILMEMLVYSREGVVEILPAVPETLDQGSIKGIMARMFARVDDLTWDMKAKTADVTITSLRDQDITFMVRHGMQTITAPAGVLASQPKADATTCVLHLQKNKPVTLHIKLGEHKPSDWVAKSNEKTN